MKSYLPIEVKSTPIRKLAIIPFEKNPDTIYRGLELQFINGAPYGTGYRIIAYRNDNFVDVYDDENLHFLKDEKFNMAENGLHQHVQTSIENVKICKNGNNQIICFEFIDIEGRKIQVNIEENANKKSKGMNLLAPIGVGSKNPNHLPVIFMYGFDFIRKRNTSISCAIDGRQRKIDGFPFPMDGQSRLYARYSHECEVIEFANTEATVLKEIELNEEKTYWDNNIEYVFKCENVLEKVLVHFENQVVQMDFKPVLDLKRTHAGVFTIKPRKEMGYLQGEYRVQAGKETLIEIIPKDGWISQPNSFVTKMILGKKSVFCNWSKKYQYESLIDWETKEIRSTWKNGNIKS